jgi:hypothetical protein
LGRHHTEETKKLKSQIGKAIVRSKDWQIKLKEAIIEARSINFRVISPEGKVYEGKNLKQFCADHCLDVGNMWRVVAGWCFSHLGWTNFEKDPKWLKLTLINSSLEIFPIYNLSDFCKTNQLNYSNMKKLKKGTIKEYKGWKLYEENN